MSNLYFFMGISSFIPIMVIIVFCIVIAIFIISFIKGVSTWNKNNNSPKLNVSAKLVSKRIKVSSHINTNNNMHHSSHTNYYATFEVESGDRMEFNLKENEYAMLAEGDIGELTFQGTRYISFLRKI